MPTFQKVLGSKIAFSSAAPATQDDAGYVALSWTAEATDCEIVDFDGFNGEWSTVADQTICLTGGADEKGKYTFGSFPITIQYDKANTIWPIIDTARKSASAELSVRILHANADTTYFQARVMKANQKFGGQDDVRRMEIDLLQTVEQIVTEA